MANIEKRGESYRITVSCGYDIYGRKKRAHMTWKPDKGMTERQIKKELERQAVLFEERCNGGGVVSGAIKFQTFAEEWFDKYAEKQLKESTVTRYRNLSKRVYIAIGAKRIDKITARDIQLFVENLGERGINETKENSGMSPKSIRCYVSFISTILDYAMKLDMIASNPCSRVTLPPLVQKEREIFTIDEASQFLELLQSEEWPYRMFFTLAVYSGMRKGELLGLEWKDISFENRTIHICRNSQYTNRKGTYTDTPKTSRSNRVLKMPESVMDMLRQYRDWQSEEFAQIGDQWEDHDRVFTQWNGKPMSPHSPLKWLIRFCEKNGLKRINIHSLRHLNATLLINSGADIRTTSAALGHSNTTTTLNIYAHTFEEAQAKASEAVADILKFGGKEKK